MIMVRDDRVCVFSRGDLHMFSLQVNTAPFYLLLSKIDEFEAKYLGPHWAKISHSQKKE